MLNIYPQAIMPTEQAVLGSRLLFSHETNETVACGRTI
jgi:hypothetical protein